MTWHFAGRSDNSEDLYYDNGQIIRSGEWVDGKKKAGIWKWFNEEGNVKIKGYFEEGRREGTWTTYDEQGNSKAYIKLFSLLRCCGSIPSTLFLRITGVTSSPSPLNW